MSITDELRKWAKDNTLQDMVLTTYPPQHAVHGVLETLLRIADRIDAEHEKATSEFLAKINAVPATDENMAEHGWVRLPKDADGEYIRIGDVLTDDAEFKSEGKVMRLMLEDEGWMVGLGCGGWTEPSIHEWHHYHAPTVEDVLREFTDAILDWAGKSGTVAETGTWSDVAAEYAKRLTLAGDAE